MPLIAKNVGGSGDFEPVPTGNQQAVCAFVSDVGMEFNDLKGDYVHKCVIVWELGEKMTDQRPFMMSKSYTVSLNEKANLRRDLEAWRGRAFTEEELAGFDVEKVIGINCLLNVVDYKKKDGTTGQKIGSISPLMKGMPKISATATEEPKWIAKRRDENEAAASKPHEKPVAKTTGPQIPAPAAPDEETTPFARPLTADFWG